MSIADIFRTRELRQEAERAAAERDKLLREAQQILAERDQLRDDERKVSAERNQLRALLKNVDIANLLAVREAVAREQGALDEIRAKVASSRAELERVDRDLAARRSSLIETEDEILLQEFGLFKPRFQLESVAEYEARLDQLRERQAVMVKRGFAYDIGTTWALNASKAEGREMALTCAKLIVRAFNTECDDIVGRVKFFNVEESRKRIEKSFEALNKVGARMGVQLTLDYLCVKTDELDLAYEYQTKKHEEKEEQRRLREQQREEAKAQKEFEAAREVLEKEEKHFRRALAAMEQRLGGTTADAERELIEAEATTIEVRLREVLEKLKEVDYRAQNASAGYVYVVSNLGAFGDGVFKIGVTRRLEPEDRIDELGDASVPFRFDTHALVFSDDAYGLERALHRHFENSRLNLINSRKEFFRATIDEIEAVLRSNFRKPVEITRLSEADEYRQSLRLRAPSGARIESPNVPPSTPVAERNA